MDVDIVCNLPDEIDKEFLIANLPQAKTKILEAKCINHLMHLKLFTSCNSIDEVKQWVNDFEVASQTSYSITVTKTVTGRYVDFKQYLHCRHKTQSKDLYNGYNKNTTRNTNCPSTLKITLHAKKKRYQNKDKARNELFKEMRCEIDWILTHNHNIGSAASLSFRKVSNEVREKLINLYSKGHSPATALHTIKMDIYMNVSSYQQILADRMHCPDYNYCYNVYINLFKVKYGPLDFDATGRDFLKKRLEEYNEQMKDNCAKLFHIDSDYIICICPPLSKRVHQFCQSASEIVFMDSSGTCDHDGSRIFVLLTHSEAGGLPLGVIITSSESANIIQTGFQTLKDMLGNIIFGGYPEGPKIFLTDDSEAEQSAIKTVWTNSKCLLCIFHVLQSIWRWLVKGKNNIPKDKRYVYFKDFKTILYSKTVTECNDNYEIAKSKIVHVNYLNYLEEEYWQRKELWALCYRNSLLTRGNNTNNISEAAMRIIKDKIFNRVKAFNVVQLVDFILTKFVNYYEIRLLDAANNRHKKPSLMKCTVKLPPTGLLERITVLSDNIVTVPSESRKDLVYIVNFDALACSCFEGITGKMCKHIHWAAIVNPSVNYSLHIDNVQIQKKFYYIATGSNPPDNWFLPLCGDSQTSTTSYPGPTIETFTHGNDVQAVNETKDLELIKKTNERAKEIFKEFNSICASYIEKSANDVGTALEKMLENMKKIRTVSAFTSACSSFASDYRRRNRRGTIPVQPTAISRRRTPLSGRKSNVGGRPRKNTQVSSKKNLYKHKLSKKIASIYQNTI